MRAYSTRKELQERIAELEAELEAESEHVEMLLARIVTQEDQLSRIADMEAEMPMLEASVDAVVDHMARCPERGGPLSWRCLGTGRLVGHGKRCTPGHRV